MSPPLLDLLLQTFPQASQPVQHLIVKMMTEIGKHYISVSQAKKIFKLLRGSNDHCRSNHLLPILQSLTYMSVKNDQPKRYFMLNGSNSVFVLPNLSNKTFSKVRSDIFEHPAGATST